MARSRVDRAQERGRSALFGDDAAAGRQRCRRSAFRRLRRRAGVLVLSGTGSMAWARDAAGRVAPHRRLGRGDRRRGQRPLDRPAGARPGQAGPRRARDAPAFLAALCSIISGSTVPTPMDALVPGRARSDHAAPEIAALARLVDSARRSGRRGARGASRSGRRRISRPMSRAARRRIGDADAALELCRRHLFQPHPSRRARGAIGSTPMPPRLPPIGGALLRGRPTPRLARGRTHGSGASPSRSTTMPSARGMAEATVTSPEGQTRMNSAPPNRLALAALVIALPAFGHDAKPLAGQIDHRPDALAAVADDRGRFRGRDRHQGRSADAVLGRYPAQAGHRR